MAAFLKNLYQAASNLKEIASNFTFYDNSYFREQDQPDNSIKDKLASSYETDTVDALKYILAQMYKGNDMRRFFPDVVICMHKQQGDIKKLAFIILTQLYPHNKENALMPINLLHKETQVKEPLRRGDALRILTDMSVNEVYPFLFDLARKNISDHNPFVRRVSLVALMKIINYTDFSTSDHEEEIREMVKYAINDKHLMVQGAALAYGRQLLPLKELLGMLHSVFFKVTQNLHNYDELLAFPICLLMALYCSYYFTSQSQDTVHQDLIILFKQLENALDSSLAQSQTLALLNLYLYLKIETLKKGETLGEKETKIAARVIKRIMSDHHYDKLCALDTLESLINLKVLNNLFNHDLFQKLKLKQNEPVEVKSKKLQILQTLFYEYHFELALQEIITVTKNPNKEIRINSIRALGECGRLLTQKKDQDESASKSVGMILHVLINLLKQKDDQIMTESMISLQKMIVKDSEQSHAIILYCINMLDKITSGRAKATMIYLLKEFIDRFPTLSKETLRRLAKGFTLEQDEQVKFQILNLASKVLSKNKDDSRVREIFEYLCKVAQNDKNLLMRQKARMLMFIFNSDKIVPEQIFISSLDSQQEKLSSSYYEALQSQPHDLLFVGRFTTQEDKSIQEGSELHTMIQFLKNMKATPEEILLANQDRFQRQELQSVTSIRTDPSQESQQPITSLGSDSFRQGSQNKNMDEQYEYKKDRRYTVQDPSMLKNEYEAFWEAPVVNQNLKVESAQKSNSAQKGKSPQSANKSNREDEYEFIEDEEEEKKE